jgi:GH15 family glucan-1,4-alpha-glucosidase
MTMSVPLEDYAMIGDRRSAALVSRSGSIDWLCWPRFDSDACFAALLGDERHGFWRLAPDHSRERASWHYRDDTMILETHHATAQGRVRVVDLMAVGTRHSAVIRQVIGEAGAVTMHSDFSPRFDYGQMPPWRRSEPHLVTGAVGPDLLQLHADVDLQSVDDRVTACFTVKPGETVTFDLQYGLSYGDAPAPIDAIACIAATETYWRQWLSRFTKLTAWPDMVKRSLLVLQSLCYAPSGGMIAAPTMGLPEVPGGEANWDYRYTWLRDSTFALSAFLNAGFTEEALAWRDWLLRAVAGDPAAMRTMYRCDGARHIDDYDVPWLPGYAGARPVHVGNTAATQRQLDIYGEVLDAMHLAAQAGIDENRPWDVNVEDRILDHLETMWRKPDQGIWESRDAPRQYTYSKAMAWVAADRFVKLSQMRKSNDEARVARAVRLREAIHRTVCRNGFSARRNSFVEAFGSERVDASLLLLPTVGFLPADDARIVGTIAAVEAELVVDGLVRRHHVREDGHAEGVFIACTCWLADCLHMQGRDGEARRYFERVSRLRNDVGLLAEEWDTATKRLSGNFPQALSHLAIINTAMRLSGPVLQRGG